MQSDAAAGQQTPRLDKPSQANATDSHLQMRKRQKFLR
ncbi:hypothetical protein [Azospirillum argentinense]